MVIIFLHCEESKDDIGFTSSFYGIADKKSASVIYEDMESFMVLYEINF